MTKVKEGIQGAATAVTGGIHGVTTKVHDVTTKLTSGMRPQPYEGKEFDKEHGLKPDASELEQAKNVLHHVEAPQMELSEGVKAAFIEEHDKSTHDKSLMTKMKEGIQGAATVVTGGIHGMTTKVHDVTTKLTSGMRPQPYEGKEFDKEHGLKPDASELEQAKTVLHHVDAPQMELSEGVKAAFIEEHDKSTHTEQDKSLMTKVKEGIQGAATAVTGGIHGVTTRLTSGMRSQPYEGKEFDKEHNQKPDASELEHAKDELHHVDAPQETLSEGVKSAFIEDREKATTDTGLMAKMKEGVQSAGASMKEGFYSAKAKMTPATHEPDHPQLQQNLVYEDRRTVGDKLKEGFQSAKAKVSGPTERETI
jgi:hypothetical protein